MAKLVLGPLLRYVGETDATVWVETDAPCEVAVCGETAQTWEVHGHHYAIVCFEGLEPGSRTTYSVELDGETVWPPEGDELPAPTIRTLGAGRPLRVAFGSCRVSAPHEPPYTLKKDDDDRGREIDALHALSLRMRDQPDDEWPGLLVWIGDQVYADEVSPKTLEFIRSRRDTSEPPGEQVADFEEYTRLYWDSWGDPSLRWLLSVVASAMVFDDHDVHDDWNTSNTWVDQMRAKPWWHDRIVGGFATYWIYQHLGNLSPRELAEDELLQRVQAHDGDAWPLVRDFAAEADRGTDGTQWSYHRDLGDTRLVVIDTRAGRCLDPGERRMVDEAEWDWIEAKVTEGGFEHLLIGASLPLCLSRGLHHLEAWNEAVCEGAYGRWFDPLGERIRQGLDLEHWAAFHTSFHELTDLLRRVGAGAHGHAAPASITVLSGDVHNAYLAEIGFPRGTGVTSAVHQATCSPFRNPLDRHERLAIRAGKSRPAELAARFLSRTARVPRSKVAWEMREGPWFDNQVAFLDIDGARIDLRVEKAAPEAGTGDTTRPRLEEVIHRPLAGGSAVDHGEGEDVAARELSGSQRG
jgi:hypothetical protein